MIDRPLITQGTGALTASALNRVFTTSARSEQALAEVLRTQQIPAKWLGEYIGRVTARTTLTANRFRYTMEPVTLTASGTVSGITPLGFETVFVYSVTEILNTAGAIRNPPINLDNLPDGFTVTYPDVGDVFQVTIFEDSIGNPIHTIETYFGVDGECEEPPA